MEIEVTRLTSEVWHSQSKIERLRAKINNPSWAVWVGAITLVIYLALLPLVERTWRATGDEPHYLLTAHSLVHDLDFDLANNYAQLDYLNFYISQDITPQILLSPSGQQILDHQLGLPVLIAPAYALAGRFGVLAFQAVLGGLLAALTFKLAAFISQDQVAALLATLFVALTPPLLLYHYLVYPELLGALLTTLVIYYAVRSNRATPTAFALTLISLLTLPWLNRRFVPLVILLVLLIAWAWRRREENWEIRRLRSWLVYFGLSNLLLLLTTLLSIGLLGWVSSQLTPVAGPDFFVPAVTSILGERIIRGLVGWLVDQQRGLFVYAPIYVFALWGLPFLISDSLRQHSRHWVVVLPFLLSLGVTTLAGGFWLAWELGPRFLVVALPSLAPLLALAWRNYHHQWLWRGLALLLFGLSLSNTLVILQNPELPYKSSLALYYGEKLGLPLTEWLPDLAGYTRVSPGAAADSTSAQVVAENGEKIWLAEPGSPVNVVRSGPLTELPFGHYHLSWPVRVEAGLPPETELLRLSLKLSGGGQIFNKVITAADLPTDGRYGEVQLAFRNPNVDRWRTPPVLTVVSSGKSQIGAKEVILAPDPFYALFLPYLFLALPLLVALWAWFGHSQNLSHQAGQISRPKSAVAGARPAFQGVMWGLALILPLVTFSQAAFQYHQTNQTYPASQLSHFVGRTVVDPQAMAGQAWLVDPQIDPPQKAVYGPFDIYESGRYHVTFRLKLPQAAPTDQDLARLQVSATTNYDQLISQPLRAEHFSKPKVYHDFVLTITNPRRQALSFEVYYLGVAPLLIDQVTITKIAE